MDEKTKAFNSFWRAIDVAEEVHTQFTSLLLPEHSAELWEAYGKVECFLRERDALYDGLPVGMTPITAKNKFHLLVLVLAAPPRSRVLHVRHDPEYLALRKRAEQEGAEALKCEWRRKREPA